MRISLFSRLILLGFGFFSSYTVWGQGPVEQGVSLIKSFAREQFRGDGKIWDITQDGDGIMYFAANNGLWEYDGTRWTNYTNPLHNNLRAVHYNKEDQILYSAGYGGFGFWKKDEKGELNYYEIYSAGLEESNHAAEFWSVGELEGHILFQSFEKLFFYTPGTQTMDSIDAPSVFSFLHKSKGRVFVEDYVEGLFEVVGDELVKIPNTGVFGGGIVGISVVEDNELLIVSDDDGVFEWKDGVLRSKRWRLNVGLKRDRIYSFQELDNGNLVFGTIMNGIYVSNKRGVRLLHFDTRKGLEKNTILSLFLDHQTNLWLGLDGGVNYLKINSGISYLLDEIAKIGTVYASQRMLKMHYIGSNQGLYTLDLRKESSRPRLVKGSQGQVWSVENIDQQIWIGHHKGAFLLKEGAFTQISNEPGAWIFQKHPKRDDIVYSGNYFGICVYKKIQGEWKFITKLNTFNESARFMEFDNIGRLWVAHPSKGYYRLLLSNDGLAIEKMDFFGMDNQNIERYAYMTRIDGNLIFFNPQGFFQFDEVDNDFYQSRYATELFEGVENLSRIEQFGDIFWYISKNSLGFIQREGNEFKNIQEPFAHFRNKHLGDFTSISKLRKNIFSIGIYDGLVFCRAPVPDSLVAGSPAAPIIRGVNLISSKDTIAASIAPSDPVSVPYRNNFIEFKIATPNAPEGDFWKVQYQLKGLTDDWSDWINRKQLNFPNLSPGDYELNLRVMDGNGNMSPIVTYSFEVEHPWYLGTFFIVLYALLVVAVFFMIREYFRRKALKEKERLQKKDEEKMQRQKEKYEREKLESEKRLLVLKEEKYRLELEQKNNELSSAAMINIRKNELLSEIKNDIKQLEKNSGDQALSSVKKLIKKINRQINSQEDWLSFELHFNNAHAHFFDKIREKHSGLTANDFKLCAYLKLNLSSKEIASLMNISVRSVEMSRYRLRKKLDLSPEESLSEYISSF
ncbi:triple tyrosine motif-containing protein [Marinilabilia rubra]|nr:triple tyrosine motif-containing protein [Marinilabilia rubra]